LEVIEVVLACHRLGAIAVPMNPRLVAEEIAFLVEDSGMDVALSDAELVGMLPATVTHRLTTGAAGTYEPALDASGPPPGPVAMHDGAPAFLMYTSGTTGRPKGAVLTHKNIVVNALSWMAELGVRSDDSWCSPLPLFHIGALVGLYPFLLRGLRSEVQPSTGFDPARSVASLRDSAASMCAYVPSQWDQIVQVANVDANLRGLRRAVWGAAPASRRLLERMTDALPPESITCTFGQTEVTANATFLQPWDFMSKPDSIGRPAIVIEHRIVTQGGEMAGPGEVGEIHYRGPTVMSGYWNRPDADASAFDGAWFRSGDLVLADAEGFLYAVDRKNDTIITGGENVYPAEVERALLSHEAVLDAAVIGAPDDRWGERPVAVVVVGGEVSDSDLLEHCRQHLAKFKVPVEVRRVDALPRNATGKVRRVDLRDDELEEQR
jgi:acyl-CoA synthetase (AMP-forming)/AMP-acid ligase II